MSEENIEALERELAELGPLMLQQEQVEARGSDPAFAAQLRARLVRQAEEHFPAPVQPVQARPPTPPQPPRWRRWFQWGGLGGATLVAAALALFFLLRPSHQGQLPEEHGVALAPTPTKATLSKSYPLLGALGGGGGGVDPTRSRIEYPPGQAYPGHMQLSAGSLPSAPSSVTAYRLRGPSFDVPRVRRLDRILGIPGPVRRLKGTEYLGGITYQTIWVMAEQGGGPTGPTHSLAISTRTGQVIYHNTTLDPKPPGTSPGPARSAAVAAARAWLTRLGWPGATMPVMTAPGFLGLSGVTAVSFGWPGVGPVDQPAATLWVVPGGEIDEALLLPPVATGRSGAPHSTAQVWRQVQAGKVPIGVKNMIAATFPAGKGTLQAVTQAHVFNPTPAGTLYLAPVYRFTGTVRFPGVAGPRAWLALAPAT